MSKRSRRNRRSSPDGIEPLPDPTEAARLRILCEDKPVIAVSKPAGMLSQGAPQGVFCLPDYVKALLKEKYEKPGNVYLGVVHRLDRPVTGVVLFSRNSKGAARLSEQFRERQVTKTYLAFVENMVRKETGTMTDFIRKVPDQARAVIEPHETAQAKEARLSYRVIGGNEEYTLVEVKPETGRMHQIRLQLASRGHPIVGDQLYGATRELDLTPMTADYTTQIALHAWKLTFLHPVRYDQQTVTAPLPEAWPKLAHELLELET